MAAPGMAKTVSELVQQNHYDAIAEKYHAHYSDQWSSEYRRRFIYEPMFAGLDLSGAKVLDAMCGSGQTTRYLLSRNAVVTGLDISSEVLTTFREQFPNSRCEQRSLLNSDLPAETFDCIAIVGGLHHIHPEVSAAVREIHRLLKPGGYFCFMEPHTGSIADKVRQIWYRHDRLFSANEAAIDVNKLRKDFAGDFIVRKMRYQGNVAFLFVLNSLVFRIPLSLKRYYSPLLLPLESLLLKFQRRVTSAFVVAQWQKA